MAETATPLQTSEQLVRALKAAQDPPAPGQLPKIELARVAWADSSFFVPKKAELLADWSLESISRSAKLSLGTEGKEKGKGKGKGKQGFQGDVPYERDARYWSLLAEVLPAVAASGPGALPALSSKYPLLPPLSALLRGVSQTEALASSSEPKTLSAAAPVLTQLLPLAAARAAAANIDAVNECLKDLLAAVPSFQGADELSACKAILESLIGSWTAALEYGANAKKSARFFSEHTLMPFLLALRSMDNAPTNADVDDLRGAIVLVGAECLFHAEALARYAEAAKGGSATAEGSVDAGSELFSRLRHVLEDGTNAAKSAALHSLPMLLTQLASRLRAQRAIFFPAASFAASGSSSLSLSAAAQAQGQHSAIRSALLRFLQRCFALVRGASVGDGTSAQPAGQATLALLECIELADVYVPAGPDAPIWLEELGSVAQRTLADLKSNPNSGRAADSIGSLRILWRLEQAVVEPLLEDLLVALAPIQAAQAAAHASFALLSTVCATYSKTRSIPALLELLFNSLDRALLAGPASEALSSALLFRGPLLAPRFADELAKALRDFATPMQVVPLLEMLSTRCAALVAQLPKSGASADGTQSPDGTPAKKRRKVGASAIEQGQGVEVSSTLVERLAVNLQLVALVLSHVPLPAPIRSDAAAAVRDIYSRVLQPALRTAFIPNPDAAQTRKSETLAACALRTRYAILGRNWRGDAQEDETDTAEEGDGDQVRVELEKGLDGVREELCERLASGVPEMRVEITRTLLHRIASDLSREEPSTSYTALLSVSSVLSSSMLSALRDGSVPANEPWDGRLHDLDAAHLGIAMWTMLTTRWAALLDRAAYPELLDQLSATLIDSFAGSSEDANSTVARLLPVSLRLVRNAAFLEMPNWRRAIISVAISATEELLKMPRSQRSSFMSSSPKPIRVEKRALLRMMNALVALGRLPIDYTPRAQREVLFSAAVWADAALGVGASEYASESDQANWAALRFFMRAVLEQQETVTAITSFDDPILLMRLLSSQHMPSEPTVKLMRASLALFETAIRSLLHTGRSNTFIDAWAVLYRIAELSNVNTALKPAASGVPGDENIDVARRGAIRLLEIILDEVEGGTKGLPDDLLNNVITSEEIQLSPADVQHHLQQAASLLEMDEPDALEKAAQPLWTLRVDMRLRNAHYAQIGDKKEGPDAMSTSIVKTLANITALACGRMQKSHTPAQRAQTISFGQQALRLLCTCHGADPASASEAAVRAVLTFAAFMAASNEKALSDELASILAGFIPRLTSEEYEQTLQVVTAGIIGAVPLAGQERIEVTDTDKSALLHTAGILLQNGPDGTSKVARRHFTLLLGYLKQILPDEPGITLGAFEMIEGVCRGKAMLLRRVEATLILTLLSISLGRSSVPRAPSAATTGPRIYACMVNILTSLVRLRQDVLLPHLPHLTAVLAQLAGLFRVLRHNLGGAQVQAVANTLPCWLDVHAPLGEAEARAYARLLTSLTIKSAPLSKAFRSTTGPGARGAESLARPFSAHAVYVLVAYVRALVVPLTTVPTGVRRELMPGLFALCDLVGEHARASAMVSMLDAGGKTLFRKLWRDWEKQRYRGQ